MKNKFLLFFIIFSILISCKNNKTNWLKEDYSSIKAAAKGTTVNFYMWSGSATINLWIDNYVAKELKERYDIKLVRVPADASVFINKLLTEKQANKQTGVMDLIWINGENFKNAKENKLLWGPFTGLLPNFNQYEILICTGKRRELWEDNLVRTITDFAKVNNCKRLSIMARPGWERVSKQWGWKKKHVQLEKWIG